MLDYGQLKSLAEIFQLLLQVTRHKSLLKNCCGHQGFEAKHCFSLNKPQDQTLQMEPLLKLAL